jgi:hypothetical protein
MTTYRADLTGDHHRLIAHLLPGDRLILTWSAGEKTIDAATPDLPWIEVFDTDPIPRICRYGTEARLTQNTLVRKRPPITAAARAVRDGGVVYVTCEMRQDTDRFGQPFGPAVPMPSGHVPVKAEASV